MMFRVSRNLTRIILLLISFAVVNAVLVVWIVHDLRPGPEVINLSGVVRGSIQRISKQALAGKPDQMIIRRIDTVLVKLIESEKPENKANRSSTMESLTKLARCWKIAKADIEAYGLDRSHENKINLLNSSEACWRSADRAVKAAQLKSEEKIRLFRYVLALSAVNCFIILLVLYQVRGEVKNKLEYLAQYDSLTELLNRASFQRIMKSEMSRSQRYDRPLSLVIFDIDRFKNINDTLGHGAGDRILEELAQVVSSKARGTDFVCRIGGEEFAVVAPETELAQAGELAERLRTDIENHEFSFTRKLSISLGGAQLIKGEGQEDFIRRADEALYKAKQTGRNRAEIAPSI